MFGECGENQRRKTRIKSLRGLSETEGYCCGHIVGRRRRRKRQDCPVVCGCHLVWHVCVAKVCVH